MLAEEEKELSELSHASRLFARGQWEVQFQRINQDLQKPYQLIDPCHRNLPWHPTAIGAALAARCRCKARLQESQHESLHRRSQHFRRSHATLPRIRIRLYAPSLPLRRAGLALHVHWLCRLRYRRCESAMTCRILCLLHDDVWHIGAISHPRRLVQ